MIADVAIDQGGCFETAKPTTHSEPVYVVDGVTHYRDEHAGAVPITATKALTNATLPYVEAIADHGLPEAVARDPSLARSVNVLDGKITYEAVAEAHDLEYARLEDVTPAVAGLSGLRRGRVGLLLLLRREEPDDEPRHTGGEGDDGDHVDE